MFWWQTLISRVWPQCWLVWCAEQTGSGHRGGPTTESGHTMLVTRTGGSMSSHYVTKMMILSLLMTITTLISLVLQNILNLLHLYFSWVVWLSHLHASHLTVFPSLWWASLCIYHWIKPSMITWWRAPLVWQPPPPLTEAQPGSGTRGGPGLKRKIYNIVTLAKNLKKVPFKRCFSVFKIVCVYHFIMKNLC